MAECPHFTKVGTCQVRGEPVVHGEQKRCQTSVGRRLCLDWQRTRAEAAEAEVERLRAEFPRLVDRELSEACAQCDRKAEGYSLGRADEGVEREGRERS